MALPGIFLIVVGSGEAVPLFDVDEFVIGAGIAVVVLLLLLAEVCNASITTNIVQESICTLMLAIVKFTSLFLPCISSASYFLSCTRLF